MSLPALHFKEGGWCEAIKASYAPGRYQPKTREEYEALATFAEDAAALDPEEGDKDATGVDLRTKAELQALLDEAKIPWAAAMSKATLIALLPPKE